MKAPKIIISGGVGAEFEDPRRQELIDRLDRARSDAFGEEPRSADCAQEDWAALWLCSVDKLEEYVRQIEISPARLAGESLYTTVVCNDIIKPWLTPAAGSDSVLSMSADEEALERDGGRCIITKMGFGVESAHIYPHSLSGPTHSRFWTGLSRFWPESVIEDWKRDVSGGFYTAHCANRITLSPDAHAYWVRCLFALKPVALSQDQKCLELEFHWLHSLPRSARVLLTTKPSLLESLDGSVDNACLFDPSTNSRVLSGRKIWLETDDPVHRPLPSVKLLQLHWTMQRLAALSGALEIYNELNLSYD
ncbi:hypothetical protein ALT_8781 [Aspergillus lentulus]|uniref:HNH nuclease domain-containing protein n=1 Tax=Aspergillus lentulus TaxID=293939 RepID=A0AAN4PRL6_ASPLE|nr:hypothetical protein ALT_8781 [Aspergillus lentulus]